MKTVRLDHGAGAGALPRRTRRPRSTARACRCSPGVFAIFGHGNVTCLSEALEAVKDEFPTWRGQNEQSMALAAIGFAKAKRRRQIMVALSSIGPGAANMVTAAGAAMANRLPVLILAGDVFANRRPDPVLQQVEHFNNPTTTVNDAFRAVTRYWDRITHPEQIISSLPQAVATMLDPADCGPAFLGLCQDTQELAFDYPEAFFEPRVHHIRRQRPDKGEIRRAAELLKKAKKPLLIAGGGVRYSLAEDALTDFAERHGLPVAETIAGRASLVHDHPQQCRPDRRHRLGLRQCAGRRGGRGRRHRHAAAGFHHRLVVGVLAATRASSRINAARFDATKHRAHAVVGDAREGIEELDAALGDWRADKAWMERGEVRICRAGTTWWRRRPSPPTPMCRAMRRWSARRTASPTRPTSR